MAEELFVAGAACCQELAAAVAGVVAAAVDVEGYQEFAVVAAVVGAVETVAEFAVVAAVVATVAAAVSVVVAEWPVDYLRPPIGGCSCSLERAAAGSLQRVWGCTAQSSAAAGLRLPPTPAGTWCYLQPEAPSLPSPAQPLLPEGTGKPGTVVVVVVERGLSSEAWPQLQPLHCLLNSQEEGCLGGL